MAEVALAVSEPGREHNPDYSRGNLYANLARRSGPCRRLYNPLPALADPRSLPPPASGKVHDVVCLRFPQIRKSLSASGTFGTFSVWNRIGARPEGHCAL